jgi:hypothetical protein
MSALGREQLLLKLLFTILNNISEFLTLLLIYLGNIRLLYDYLIDLISFKLECVSFASRARLTRGKNLGYFLGRMFNTTTFG